MIVVTIEKLLVTNARTRSLGKMGDHYQPECPHCGCYLKYNESFEYFCPNKECDRGIELQSPNN